jgi:hypothetical protein
MKKIKPHIAFLLLIYLFGSFQPVLPLIDYLVNYDYIVENLCEQRNELENLCMGSCYLNEQLKEKILEQQSKPEKSEAKINLLMLSFHFAEDDRQELKTFEDFQYFHYLTIDLRSYKTKPLLPPPQFV